MKVLGIDQSYTGSGFCVVDEQGNVVDFGTFKTDTQLDVYGRAMEVTDFIINKISEHCIMRLNIEGLAFGIRGSATRDLAGLLFVIITHVRRNTTNVECKVIPPTTLKKFATGSGKADKAAMIAAVPDSILSQFKSIGYKKTTGLADVCDAYWLSLI